MPDAKKLSAALYAKCVSDFPPDHLFYQQDLLSLGVIPDGNLNLLLECAQLLVQQNLFGIFFGKDDRLAWRVRSQSDAEM